MCILKDRDFDYYLAKEEFKDYQRGDPWEIFEDFDVDPFITALIIDSDSTKCERISDIMHEIGSFQIDCSSNQGDAKMCYGQAHKQQYDFIYP